MLIARGATHSQVVQLLRTSGPSPSFVVFSSLPFNASPVHRQGVGPASGDDDVTMRANIKSFKDKVDSYFTKMHGHEYDTCCYDDLWLDEGRFDGGRAEEGDEETQQVLPAQVHQSTTLKT